MKLLKISSIVLVSVSLIYLGACRNPLKRHDNDKNNSNQIPNNEMNDNGGGKHSQGDGRKKNKD